MSAEEATAASFVAEPEASVEVVEITMGADVVELLVPPEAVWFRGIPPMAVEMTVVFGVDVVEIWLIDGRELVAFDGLVGCDVLRAVAAASTLAFLSLNLLAISPYNEVSLWARRLDGNGVIIAWREADRGDSRANTLETI